MEHNSAPPKTGYPIPAADPITGGELYISELTGVDSGVRISGRFEVPRYARLDAEHQRFLEAFLRSRGMLNGVERELGISYPTVRARLDALLDALDLKPAVEPPPVATPPSAPEEPPKPPTGLSDEKRRALEQLESGEISPEEAKKILGSR
jgi:hypothetical protein